MSGTPSVIHGKARGCVVEVGDGDVGVAADDRRTIRLHLAQDVDGSGRIRPVEGEVAGHGDEVGLLLRIAFRTAASATEFPWTSDSTMILVIELPRGASGRCSARRS